MVKCVTVEKLIEESQLFDNTENLQKQNDPRKKLEWVERLKKSKTDSSKN